MEETQLDFILAAKLRDEGIAAAEDNTENHDPGWQDHALSYLAIYNPGIRFLAEDFREWAYKQGLNKPASERAWGAVFLKARRRGMLVHVGYIKTKTPGQHRCPGALYEKPL